MKKVFENPVDVRSPSAYWAVRVEYVSCYKIFGCFLKATFLIARASCQVINIIEYLVTRTQNLNQIIQNILQENIDM